MKVIIDSNILFSAIIKDSATRNLVVLSNAQFLFPEYIFEEILEHKAELLNKSFLSEEEFNTLIQTILKYVSIVPNSILIPHRPQAIEILKNIDLDDVLFIACALAYPESVIWSDDKKLKQQDKIRILNTSEMIELSSQEPI